MYYITTYTFPLKMNRVIILIDPTPAPTKPGPCVIEHITFADGNKRSTPIDLCRRGGANEGDSDGGSGGGGGGGCTTFGGSALDIDYVSDGN